VQKGGLRGGTVTNLDFSAAACTDTDNGVLSPMDVRSDQPLAAACTRDSVDCLRPPLDTRPLCVRRCVHVIGQSHNRRGADCTLASWNGKRGRYHGSRLDKVVSNSDSALLGAYARWGGGGGWRVYMTRTSSGSSAKA